VRYQRLYDGRLVSERDVSLLKYKIEELEHDSVDSRRRTTYCLTERKLLEESLWK
jgi:hypothetical protein